jgi:hypothetical protein
MLRLGGRAKALAWAVALAWAAFTGGAVLLAWAWMDMLMDAAPVVRVAGFVIAGLAAVAMLLALLKRAAVNWNAEALVRRLDAAGAARGQIISGFDLSRKVDAPAQDAGLTRGLAQLAITRAGELALRAPLALAAPAAGVKRALLAVASLAAITAILAVSVPSLFGAEWSRLTDPRGDHPAFSTIRIDVDPGNVKVAYGGDLDIRATVTSGVADRLETVLVNSSGEEDIVPMFAESGGQWRTSLANVTAAGQYYVRARQGRTQRFSIDVITVPRITGISVRITPPAYTHLAAVDGPIPAAGIAALPGTLVEFTVRSNRPLGGGTLAMDANGTAQKYPLSPAPGDGTQVQGKLIIRDAGKLTLDVTDIEHQNSREPFATAVTLLADDRPFVRIVEPRDQSFATPDAPLPVQLMAEDDYGLTTLSLLRSLNDSRAIGIDLPLAAGEPTRQRGEMVVPLKGLGLKPGDTIRLTGRAQDNDPAGAKGSESPVAVVQIISQDDYNRMLLARAGMDMLLSKYEQAQRRLEAEETSLRKLKEQLGKLSPDSPLAQELRKQAGDIADAAVNDANEIDEARDLALPFDIDKALTPKLEDVANQLRTSANRLKTGTQSASSVKDETALVDELIKGVDQTQGDFAQQATIPLEFLAAIYPLIADQQKFVQIYQREDGLAQRLVGFADGVEDPKDKARLRDMEQEQLHIRQGLEGLLEDIANHVKALPADPRLDSLRKSATDFADAVGQSGADDGMNAAESALAAFWGKSGQLEAAATAKILKSFIADNQNGGMGQAAQGALAFQPSLGANLGNSVAQLLKANGLGGGSGGYAMPGESGQGGGLYGNMPLGMATGRGNLAGGLSAGGTTTNTPGAPGGQESTAGARTGSAQAVPVPPQYRHKVDQYFQRLADELQKE